MPTSSIPKTTPTKKCVPVKWRDSAWSPRIVIRSVDRRRPAFGFPQSETWTSDRDSAPASLPSLSRAGERLPGSSELQAQNRSLPLAFLHPRFRSTSRLDNLF